jgi:hypothetical protein
LLVYWTTNPPLHQLLGGILAGLSGRTPEGTTFKPSTPEEIEALVNSFGGK